jgi:hypothetical protein
VTLLGHVLVRGQREDLEREKKREPEEQNHPCSSPIGRW